MGEMGNCYVNSSNSRQIFLSLSFSALDMDRFHFLVFSHDFPPPPLITSISSAFMANAYWVAFFTESACRLTVSIEVIVHDTRAPNTGGSPKHYFLNFCQ